VKLTVTVITFNEATHIAAALESVSWADEILVVDSGSTDDTVSIAQTRATRVLARHWSGYSDQKNFAAEHASHDWVLSLDADERVTPPLAAEIQRLLADGPGERGYRIKRVSYYHGRWIRTTDWYPDFQLRLYDRRAGRWNGLKIHESFRLHSGRPGTLRGEMEHYAYRDISHHLQKIDAYTTLIADQWLAEGRRVSLPKLAVHPAVAFFRNFVVRRGFMDGGTGLVVSLLNSFYVFLKLAKLWERQR
jgi:glycosyltransferase involved in cell wall biosynthesis